jgi:hypothetical protein
MRNYLGLIIASFVLKGLLFLLIFVFVAGLDTNRGCSATDVVSQ